MNLRNWNSPQYDTPLSLNSAVCNSVVYDTPRSCNSAVYHTPGSWLSNLWGLPKLLKKQSFKRQTRGAHYHYYNKNTMRYMILKFPNWTPLIENAVNVKPLSCDSAVYYTPWSCEIFVIATQQCMIHRRVDILRSIIYRQVEIPWCLIHRWGYISLMKKTRSLKSCGTCLFNL